MRYEKFHVKGFKGINVLEFDLGRKPIGSVYTLVGLNESGKTTVLEAISAFHPRLVDVPESEKNSVIGQPNTFIPKSLKANFTGSIFIKAYASFSDADVLAIQKFCLNTLEAEIDTADFSRPLEIRRELKYDSSEYQASMAYWNLSVRLKKGGQRKFREYRHDNEGGEWLKVVNFIEGRLPRISYFPTFLFEIPEKIFLAERKGEARENAYYRKLFRDIFASISPSLDVQRHFLDRVQSKKNDPELQQQIDAVLLQVAAKIRDVVFDAWHNALQRPVQKRDIRIRYGVEAGDVYISLMMIEGTTQFALRERSLGFRWFFCFLLFTQFRRNTNDELPILFLFDEPASNLHPRAQKEMLQSLQQISKNQNTVIYSTHSHHMIGVRWLENTFIVRNRAIDYDAEVYDLVGDSALNTDIEVVRYREFAGQHPDKRTYFQPILDQLAYCPSEVECVSPALFVEGKNDFYMLKYFERRYARDALGFVVMPQNGASGQDANVALYLGWNRPFLVLLDDDTEGRKQRDAYVQKWLLPENVVFTLGDLDSDLHGMRIEGLLEESDLKLIASHFGSERASKKDIGYFFQEIVGLDSEVGISEIATTRIIGLLEAVAQKMRTFV